MIAEQLESFRADYNESYSLYLDARQCFIDELSLEEYTKYTKLMRNSQDFNKIEIKEISTCQEIFYLFNAMVDLYDEYQVLNRRSKFRLIE